MKPIESKSYREWNQLGENPKENETSWEKELIESETIWKYILKPNGSKTHWSETSLHYIVGFITPSFPELSARTLVAALWWCRQAKCWGRLPPTTWATCCRLPAPAIWPAAETTDWPDQLESLLESLPVTSDSLADRPHWLLLAVVSLSRGVVLAGEWPLDPQGPCWSTCPLVLFCWGPFSVSTLGNPRKIGCSSRPSSPWFDWAALRNRRTSWLDCNILLLPIVRGDNKIKSKSVKFLSLQCHAPRVCLQSKFGSLSFFIVIVL